MSASDTKTNALRRCIEMPMVATARRRQLSIGRNDYIVTNGAETIEIAVFFVIIVWATILFGNSLHGSEDELNGN